MILKWFKFGVCFSRRNADWLINWLFINCSLMFQNYHCLHLNLYSYVKNDEICLAHINNSTNLKGIIFPFIHLKEISIKRKSTKNNLNIKDGKIFSWHLVLSSCSWFVTTVIMIIQKAFREIWDFFFFLLCGITAKLKNKSTDITEHI